MHPFDHHRPPHPSQLPPGVVPLRYVANVIDSGRQQLVYGLCLVILVPMTGCLGLLMGPLLIVDQGYGVWPAILVAVALLAGMTAGLWFGARKMLAGWRSGFPAFAGGWVNGDRLDLTSSDGSLRTLSLHSPDLRVEHHNALGNDQVVLVGAEPNGRPVAVVMVHTPRQLLEPPTRQADPVLWAVITAAERSPHPAGRQVAEQLRPFIGTQDGFYKPNR